MALEIIGKLTQVLPKMEGVSQAGNHWEKQEFVIEQPGQYPKNVAFQDFNARAGLGAFNVGEYVKVSFNAESREYNGKFYTTLTAWKIEPMSSGQQPAAQMQPAQQQDVLPASNDLPF